MYLERYTAQYVTPTLTTQLLGSLPSVHLAVVATPQHDHMRPMKPRAAGEAPWTFVHCNWNIECTASYAHCTSWMGDVVMHHLRVSLSMYLSLGSNP